MSDRWRTGPRHAERAGRNAGRPTTDVTLTIVNRTARHSDGRAWYALLGTAVARAARFGVICLVLPDALRAWAWPADATRSCGRVYITNFVFWVGIAHSGTLISAILFLFRARWRTVDLPRVRGDDGVRGDDRGAVPAHPPRPRRGSSTGCCRIRTSAASGRTSARRSCGTCSRSATYFTVSTCVLLHRPDPGHRRGARPRDRTGARSSTRSLSLGWRGTDRAVAALHARLPLPRRARDAAGALGALRRVLGLRDGASCPGWHATIFAPYFVAGAIFSGVAMVITLLVPDAQDASGSKRSSPIQHFENLAKLLLLTGMIVCYAYPPSSSSPGTAASTLEREAFWYRAFGHLLVGGLDHAHLQRVHAAAAVVQEHAHQHHGAVRDLRSS